MVRQSALHVWKVATRTLCDLGLESEGADKQQGVYVGLSKIITSTSRDIVFTFVDSKAPTVRRALSDRDPNVRQTAARTINAPPAGQHAGSEYLCHHGRGIP